MQGFEVLCQAKRTRFYFPNLISTIMTWMLDSGKGAFWSGILYQKSAPESHETTLGQYLNDDSASQQPSSPGIEGSDLLSEGSAKGLTEDPQNLVLQNKNQRGMSKRAQKKQAKRDRVIATLHCDVIKDAFWLERNEILG